MLPEIEDLSGAAREEPCSPGNIWENIMDRNHSHRQYSHDIKGG